MRPLPLGDARDPGSFGGKAVQLGEALRAGLPVPQGFALSVALVEAVAGGDDEAAARVGALWAGDAVAVRSSAAGEDGPAASFAGQHRTVLNVRSADALVAAVREVAASGAAVSAMAYRRRLGLDETARVGVVVQDMIDPECAGVLFTRNPVSGAHELVVEASWGLGEAVVAGRVTPDRWRLDRGGRIVQTTIGNKDVAVRPDPAGFTRETPLDAVRARTPCLDAVRLARLGELALACERFGRGALDLEFAFDHDGGLHLLQWRPVTRSR